MEMVSPASPRKAWGTVWPAVAAALLPVLCLAPFANKAFHIDDPMYLWVARQIQAHPADFFRFDVNWYDVDQPMYEINKNPPGASYYIAAVSAVFGENERWLHVAFWLPLCALSLGTNLLARRLTSRPFLATLIAVFSPVFLLSSSNVMIDTPMMAFYVWAVLGWIKGIDRHSYALLVLAGLAIACSALTKYFGASLIPLLFVYTLARERRIGRRGDAPRLSVAWLLPLGIPLLGLGAYETYTFALYGKGMFGEAAHYAASINGKQGIHYLARPLIALTFTGGCFVAMLGYAPLLASRRAWYWAGLVAAMLLAALSALAGEWQYRLFQSEGLRYGYLVQWLLFALGGCLVLALAASDAWRRRDADAVLLACWIFGTFLFAAFLNWNVAGRTVLPMAPAFGILVARRIEDAPESLFRRKPWTALLPVIPSALIAFALLHADALMANSARDAATQIDAKTRGHTRMVWYTGGWGFQWYMDLVGARKLPMYESCVKQGDVLVIPQNNGMSQLEPTDTSAGAMRTICIITLPTCAWLSTMSRWTGAGFYASVNGPLPYVFGPSPPEGYIVFQIVPPNAKPR